MVTFKNLGINFVHAPKTGGTAICRALAELNGNLSEWEHAMRMGIQGIYHDTILHGPCPKPLPGVTAVFIREPGSLVESCYNYAANKGAWRKGIDAFLDLMETAPLQLPEPLWYYVRQRGFEGYLEHTNFTGEFEHLEEDFFRLTGGRGSLQHINKQEKQSFTGAQLERATEAWGDL